MATRRKCALCVRPMPCGVLFQGTEKRLVCPWTKGLKVEDILGYYDEIGFSKTDARGEWRAGAEGAAPRV
jgi:formate-dependent nitrite reductase cytochrome c552 subunit